MIINLELIVVIIIIGLLIGWFSTTGTKSQFVRLLDVFLYGPILIYTGTVVDNVYLKIALILIGASTMSYNFKNYVKMEKN